MPPHEISANTLHQPGPEDAAAAKKSRKAKGKEAKLRRKAKEELQSFRSLMGMAGICIALGRASTSFSFEKWLLILRLMTSRPAPVTSRQRCQEVDLDRPSVVGVLDVRDQASSPT